MWLFNTNCISESLTILGDRQQQIVEQLLQGDARHRRVGHIVDVHRHRLLPGGVLEDVDVLSHFRILLEVLEELVAVLLNVRVQRVLLGEVLELPVAALSALGFVVVIFEQQQLRNRVLLEFLKVAVVDVSLGQVVPEFGIPHFEEVTQVGPGVDRVLVDAQFGRFHGPGGRTFSSMTSPCTVSFTCLIHFECGSVQLNHTSTSFTSFNR